MSRHESTASEEVVLRVPHGAPATRPHNPLSSQRRHPRRLLARLRALAEKVNP